MAITIIAATCGLLPAATGTLPLIPHSRSLTDAAADCGGAESAPCCPGRDCLRPDLTCRAIPTDTCVFCGTFGVPVCTDPTVPACAPDLLPSEGNAEVDICLPPPRPPPAPPPCGGDYAECCDGDACDHPTLTCVDGRCVGCGDRYDPPCTDPGVEECNRPLTIGDLGQCQQSLGRPPPGPDVPCGGLFAFCCDGSACDSADLACVEGRCYPCGTLGQVACGADYVEDPNIYASCFFYLQPDYDDGLRCTEPACGGVVELCCDRTACDGDLVCNERLCRPCGTLGQAACDYGADTEYPPDPPGVNEPFCADDGLAPDEDGVCVQLPCGADRGPCCEEGGEACEGDLTCFIPESGGICADEYSRACGYEYAPCCGASVCEPGLGCNDNSCTSCGADGYQACTDVGFFQCAPGLFVNGEGVCVEAAGPLPPPPPPPGPPGPKPFPKPFPPLLRPCGGRLAECCDGGGCNSTDLACRADRCLPCGGRGQFACPVATGGSSEGGAPCKMGLQEISGVCIPVPSARKHPARPSFISFGGGSRGGKGAAAKGFQKPKGEAST